MAIPFTIIQLDKPRKLRFGMGAQVEFEQSTGIMLTSLDTKNTSASVLYKALWIMLRQEDEALSFKDACNLVDEYAEDVQSVLKKVGEAIQAAFKQKDNKIPNSVKPKA